MKKLSRIYLTCLYLYQTQNKTAFEGSEIFKSQDEAHKYWIEQLPIEFWEKEKEILSRNGFTKEAWEEVLQYSGHFAFIPTEAMKKCNKEMKTLVNKYILMNGTIHQTNCFYDMIHGAVKNKQFIYLTREPQLNKPYLYIFHPLPEHKTLNK